MIFRPLTRNSFVVLAFFIALVPAMVAWRCSTKGQGQRAEESSAQHPVKESKNKEQEVSEPQEGKLSDHLIEVSESDSAISSGPLEFRLGLDVDFEHGCSQSMEHRSISGTLGLEISAEDKAKLTLELEEYYTFGPSLGKFKQGHKDFTHRFWKEHKVWKGKSKRQGDTLVVNFTTVEAARQEFPMYGEAKLPPAKQAVSALKLTCSYKKIEVYKYVHPDKNALDTENETPRQTDALMCMPNQEMFDWYKDYVLIAGALAFGEAPGFILTYRKMFWTEDKVIRRAE